MCKAREGAKIIELLQALLKDAQSRSARLELPHGGPHSDRFTHALQSRNMRMAGVGQPMWAHACDDCEVVLPRDPTRGETQCCKCYLSRQLARSSSLW